MPEYFVFRNLLPSEFLSVVFSAQKKSQGLPQPVLGGKEKAAACTDSRPSVSTSKLDGQRSYASPKSKSGRPDVTDVKEKASSAYESFFIGTSESLAQTGVAVTKPSRVDFRARKKNDSPRSCARESIESEYYGFSLRDKTRRFFL